MEDCLDSCVDFITLWVQYLLNGSGSGSCWRKDFVEVEILSRES